ncbi:hypothetical protein [Sphingomonas sp.]|nr:hypothetical protein [Sphingomonas sp.]HWK35401.1 hypothetical protein [Sphingomonas sp.]
MPPAPSEAERRIASRRVVADPAFVGPERRLVVRRAADRARSGL